MRWQIKRQRDPTQNGLTHTIISQFELKFLILLSIHTHMYIMLRHHKETECNHEMTCVTYYYFSFLIFLSSLQLFFIPLSFFPFLNVVIIMRVYSGSIVFPFFFFLIISLFMFLPIYSS